MEFFIGKNKRFKSRATTIEDVQEWFKYEPQQYHLTSSNCQIFAASFLNKFSAGFEKNGSEGNYDHKK